MTEEPIVSENILKPEDPSLVVCAMSGGVDSSVAAMMLHEVDVPVVGVSMQVWDYRNHGGSDSKATCCAPSDFNDARKVASEIGIPYYVFDLEETFREHVIDNFVNSYYNGVTPNPCIDCNSKVKFKELRHRALTFGCSHVATGHYAQIVKDEHGYRLRRGADLNKDQSYFLYGLTQEELASTIFPVGHLQKSQVRERAAESGLVTAQKPESQDICFVSGTAKEFVVKIGRRPQLKGSIIGIDGTVLGTHTGVHGFTVGQRRGIGISGTSEPLYVLEINPHTQEVVVGSKRHLSNEGFFVQGVNWINPELRASIATDASASLEFEALVQVRSRPGGTKVRVKLESEREVSVEFLEQAVTVSPGQAAVFYDPAENREVLGGGRIRLQLRHSRKSEHPDSNAA